MSFVEHATTRFFFVWNRLVRHRLRDRDRRLTVIKFAPSKNHPVKNLSPLTSCSRHLAAPLRLRDKKLKARRYRRVLRHAQSKPTIAPDTRNIEHRGEEYLACSSGTKTAKQCIAQSAQTTAHTKELHPETTKTVRLAYDQGRR